VRGKQKKKKQNPPPKKNNAKASKSEHKPLTHTVQSLTAHCCSFRAYHLERKEKKRKKTITLHNLLTEALQHSRYDCNRQPHFLFSGVHCTRTERNSYSRSKTVCSFRTLPRPCSPFPVSVLNPPAPTLPGQSTCRTQPPQLPAPLPRILPPYSPASPHRHHTLLALPLCSYRLLLPHSSQYYSRFPLDDWISKHAVVEIYNGVAPALRSTLDRNYEQQSLYLRTLGINPEGIGGKAPHTLVLSLNCRSLARLFTNDLENQGTQSERPKLPKRYLP